MDLRVAVHTEGCRRLVALIANLPPDSALARSDHPWQVGDQLLAGLIEVTDMWGRIIAITGGQKRDSLPKPVRIPRPGAAQEDETPQVTNSATDVMAFISKHNRQGGNS